MRHILLSLSLFIFSVAFSQNTGSTKHTVAEGESLYAISKKYNTSVAKLIELNPEVDNGIKTGMVLNVTGADTKAETPKEQPAIRTEQGTKTTTKEVEKAAVQDPQKSEPSSTGQAARANEHTVVEGDTYYSLSRKYKTTVSDLQALNAGAPLKIGQKIVIAAPNEEASTQEQETKVVESVLFKEETSHEQNSAKSENTKESKNTAEAPQEAPKQETQAVEAKNTLTEVKVEKRSDKTVVSAVDTKIPATEPVTYENDVKRILIIPFDPYLYFSDADMEISKQSKMEHTKVRQAFRRRLNALLEPQGYETIHLLGGRIKDSLTDLNRIYKSVSYNYQDALYNPSAQVQRTQMVDGHLKEADKTHVVKETNDPLGNSRASLAKDESKYYGVKIADPNFFPYFNSKYRIDYYIFVNQFEVKTNYATCLDRTTKNYERNFITHFSIFDNTGKQISGNRIKIHYESNENNIQRILTDNMQKVASQIIGELPKQ